MGWSLACWLQPNKSVRVANCMHCWSSLENSVFPRPCRHLRSCSGPPSRPPQPLCQRRPRPPPSRAQGQQRGRAAHHPLARHRAVLLRVVQAGAQVGRSPPRRESKPAQLGYNWPPGRGRAGWRGLGLPEPRAARPCACRGMSASCRRAQTCSEPGSTPCVRSREPPLTQPSNPLPGGGTASTTTSCTCQTS